jgi:hypothetical protein
MMKKIVLAGLATLALAVIPGTAQAAPIVGEISFGGTGDPVPPTSSWYNSEGVEFNNPWVVVGGNGAYAGLFGSLTTFTDFNWGNGTGPSNVALSQTIWEFTSGMVTYRLTAGTITNISRGTVANDNISVVGNGTLEIVGGMTNFDPTPGTFSFTAGFTPGGAPNLSFSADDSDVPEPASMALLGLGLLGAGVARRRSRR